MHKSTLECIEELNAGIARIAQKESDGSWSVNIAYKMAVLDYFSQTKAQEIHAGDLHYFDKIPIKSWAKEDNVRVVPPGVVRYGAHIEPGAILMPSFVNIGAYIGSGTMVDTWATVGSCAQVGRNVHISGGVGLGGVLEPVQARPVIVEDEVFIGSRSIIVEGVLIRERAVIGAGVVLTASTPIIDVRGEKELVLRGEVPPLCVVIPGMRPKTFASGTYQTPCALIIATRSERTDAKTSLNAILRETQVAV